MIMKIEKILMTLTVTNISGYGGRDDENYDDGWFISLSLKYCTLIIIIALGS